MCSHFAVRAQPEHVTHAFLFPDWNPYLGDLAQGEYFIKDSVISLVLILSPGALSIFEDAVTAQPMPASRNYLARTHPVGPDS